MDLPQLLRSPQISVAEVLSNYRLNKDCRQCVCFLYQNQNELDPNENVPIIAKSLCLPSAVLNGARGRAEIGYHSHPSVFSWGLSGSSRFILEMSTGQLQSGQKQEVASWRRSQDWSKIPGSVSRLLCKPEPMLCLGLASSKLVSARLR